MPFISQTFIIKGEDSENSKIYEKYKNIKLERNVERRKEAPFQW